MKNLGYNLVVKSGFQILAVTALVAGLYSCDKNKGSNNVQPVTNVYQNCTNCAGIQGSQFFRSASTSTNGNIIMSMNFFGNTVFQPYMNYLGSPVVTYAGAVAVQGAMHVNNMANINGAGGGCIFPAGDYTLQTIQAGQWSSAVFSQVRLLATGPTQIYLTMSMGQVSAKKYNDMGKLWTEIPQEGNVFSDVVVESVAGLRCGQSFLIQ